MVDKSDDNAAIEDAKRDARECIKEAWPTVREVVKPTSDMYEFDAIRLDGAPCGIASISVMHDPGADVFALVEVPQVDSETLEEGERELQVADLMSQIELKVMMLMQASRTEEEISAAWAAVSSTTAQSARLRLHEIGSDIDKVRRDIDKFFLENPE